MDAPFQVRPAEPGDVARVAAIELEAFADPWPESAFRRAAQGSGDGCFLVAAGDTVVGYLIARRAGEEAEILNLAVAGERQRQGVAAALVRAALTRLRAAGVREVFLEVRQSNAAAQALYRRFGFGIVGRRARYYRRPVEDALVLRAAITTGQGSAEK